MPTRAHALAKLSRPRLPRVARRARLFARLDALSASPCVWICGPAGSGKTTLAADYLQARKHTSFWFHVDEGDTDPSAAISYLITLARLAREDAAAALPYLTPEHLADLQGYCRRFFRAFYQCLPQNCALLFDNCQRADSEAFRLVLNSAVQEVPHGIRLFVLSRHQLPAELVTAQANRQVVVIDADALRLDIDESRAVSEALSGHLHAGLEALHGMCDGWVAGLVLLLSRTSRGTDAQAEPRLDRSSREALFTYFANELLRSASPDVRDLLLRTALLRTVTAEQARLLADDPHAEDLLEDLYRRHCFTVRRESAAQDVPVSYVYHDLFRAYLLDRLVHELEADALRTLRTRAAQMLERARAVADAVEQYCEAACWPDAARLIRAEAPRLVDEGQLRTLGQWLQRLPEDVLKVDPWLRFHHGHVVALEDPGKATAEFEAVHQSFVLAADEPGQYAAALATMETMMMRSVSYKPWDRWIDVLGRLLPARPPEDPESAVRAWHALLYTCLYRRANHSLIASAVEVLDRALFSERLRPTQAMQAATGLLAYAHFACDEALAARVMPVLQRWLDTDQLAVMSRILGATWLMVYHYFDARYDQALRWADNAREMVDAHGFSMIARVHGCYRVQALVHLGEHVRALAEAERIDVSEADARNSFAAAYAANARALAYFADGQIARAIALGDVALEGWMENGFETARLAWAQSMQAIYRMAHGEIDRGLELVEEASGALAGTVCSYSRALHALLRAHAAQVSGERQAAIEHLRVALTGNHKALAPLSWARPFLPDLFCLAWQESIARDTVSALISEWRIAPPGPDEMHWPRPISIRLFGHFEVQRFGQTIHFGRKPPRKLLALLEAVAISGQRGLSMDSACQYFWPDLDGDAAIASLTAALYRLRKMLACPDAIRVKGSRLSLDRSIVWVDLTAFRRLSESAEPRDLQRALDLYRGPLLPDQDEPWCTPARLHARDAFARLVERLAVPLETTDIEAAQDLYLRAIEAEPLAEASYRGLMRCHARFGRSAEVLRVYRRLRQTLSVVLGVEPSAESQRLRGSLLEASNRAALRAADTPPSDRSSTARR